MYSDHSLWTVFLSLFVSSGREVAPKIVGTKGKVSNQMRRMDFKIFVFVFWCEGLLLTDCD